MNTLKPLDSALVGNFSTSFEKFHKKGIKTYDATSEEEYAVTILKVFITPDVAKVEGKINAGGSVTLDKKCDENLEVPNWCIGPPRIEGRVTLGGWYGKAIDYEWEEKKICSND